MEPFLNNGQFQYQTSRNYSDLLPLFPKEDLEEDLNCHPLMRGNELGC